MAEGNIVQLYPRRREVTGAELSAGTNLIAVATGIIAGYLEDGQPAAKIGRAVSRYVCASGAGVEIQNMVADHLLRSLQEEFDATAVCEGAWAFVQASRQAP